MYSFTVDPRSGFPSNGNPCNTCCCETISARAGETNKIMVNYAPWSAPLGGFGLTPETVFDIEGCKTCPAIPLVNPGFERTVMNTAVQGDLALLYPNPSGDPVEYDILGLFPPAHGRVVLNVDGTFEYTPNTSFTGIDRFWWSANGHVAELIIAVDPSLAQPIAQPPFTPAVGIIDQRTGIDRRLNLMSFVLAVSPAAVTGDIYRLNVKQTAMNCDYSKFEHISCFDIIIGKCG